MEEKEIVEEISPEQYKILTQPTLLMHILQNFVQNAVKFTPKGGKIMIRSYLNKDGFFVHVIDEGIGIDESKDLFAPFKRYGNQTGAGLGLFLPRMPPMLSVLVFHSKIVTMLKVRLRRFCFLCENTLFKFR